jgi:hypothetical protein
LLGNDVSHRQAKSQIAFTERSIQKSAPGGVRRIHTHPNSLEYTGTIDLNCRFSLVQSSRTKRLQKTQSTRWKRLESYFSANDIYFMHVTREQNVSIVIVIKRACVKVQDVLFIVYARRILKAFLSVVKDKKKS